MNKKELLDQLHIIKGELAQAIRDEDYEEVVICEEAIAQLENDLEEQE